MSMVADLNHLSRVEQALHGFLVGATRTNLEPVRTALLDHGVRDCSGAVLGCAPTSTPPRAALGALPWAVDRAQSLRTAVAAYAWLPDGVPVWEVARRLVPSSAGDRTRADPDAIRMLARPKRNQGHGEVCG